MTILESLTQVLISIRSDVNMDKVNLVFKMMTGAL